MPSAAFFAQLGMYVVPSFLSPSMCAKLRSEMASSTTTPALIRDDSNHVRVDEHQRAAGRVDVTQESRNELAARLLPLLPSLAQHFEVILSGCQPLSFLRYGEGDHYEIHVDSTRDPAASNYFRERRVSVSLFLNGEGDTADSAGYSGGSLVFYSGGSGYHGQGHHQSALRLQGEQGLLVGFRSDWPHSVQPVTRGVRYSVVTWFY